MQSGGILFTNQETNSSRTGGSSTLFKMNTAINSMLALPRTCTEDGPAISLDATMVVIKLGCQTTLQTAAQEMQEGTR